MLARKTAVLLLSFAALITSSVANAALVITTYTDAKGELSSAPPDAAYMNPTGEMTFAISAGLDRKVRVELRKKSGALIDSATSRLLGAEDKIAVNDESFYGARLTLPDPDEGEYETVVKILDSSDKPVQVERHSWTLDRSGYQFDGTPKQNQHSDSSSVRNDWQLTGRYTLTVKADIVGGGAPVTSAVLTVTSLETGAQGTFEDFNITNTLVTGIVPKSSSLWPEREGEYELDMAVTDAAGNTTHTQWRTQFDLRSNPYTIVGVTYQGNDRPHPWSNIAALKEFTPYEPNMAVDVYNPRLLIRVAKTDLSPNSPYGLYGPPAACRAVDKSFCFQRAVLHESGSDAFVATKSTSLGSHEPVQYSLKATDRGSNTNNTRVFLGAKNSVPVRPDFSIKKIEFRDGDVVYKKNTKRNASQSAHYKIITAELDNAQANELTVRGEWGETTTIPAGEKTFVLFTWDRYTRFYDIRVCTTTTPKLCASSFTSVLRDITPPELLNWSYSDENKGEYHVEIKEQYNPIGNAWDLTKATLSATDESGETFEIDPSSSQRNTTNHSLVFSLGELPTGHFDMSLSATDKFDNSNQWDLESRDHDGVPPSIELKAYGQALGEQALKALGDVNLLLDDHDSQATPVSIELRGGPTDQSVSLAWTRKGDGRYALEYPIMFPSAADGDYELVVSAADETGNIATTSRSFTYEPLRVSLVDDNDGAIDIPALKHAFKRADGNNLIRTNAFKLSDGSTLNGTYDVFATVRADAAIPVMINGVRVEPGQTRSVVGDHDFSSSEGRLSISLAAADAELAGSAEVLVSTSAPGAAVVSTQVRAWKANVQLSAPNWAIHQAIEELKIDAQADSGTDCRLTSDERRAKQANPITDPVCYVEWDAMPADAISAQEATGNPEAPGLRGRATKLGDNTIEYSVWLYDIDGNPYLMQQGTKTLKVTNPDGVVAFKPNKDVSEVYHAVESIDVGIEQSDGPDCIATTNRELAARSGGSRRLMCLVEWTALPAGLSQLSYRDNPQVRGKVENGGINEMAWRLSTFSGNGDKIVLNEQSVEIDSVVPPEPAITMGDEYRFAPGMYAAPMEGGYLGDAKITSYNAPLKVDLARAGKIYDSTTSPAGWGDKNVVQRRVNADVRDLWSQTEYVVGARYADLPEAGADKTFTVVAVPSRNIAPAIEVDGDTVLNTEPLDVTARMEDPFADGGYDPTTMGEWQVRIVQLRGREVTPITEYQAMSSAGVKAFSLNLDEIEQNRLRLSAQAMLVSPVEGYERTVLSSRPVYMTVLRGEPIDSTIEGRRISGEAPLMAVMTLKIDDRLDKAALGDVKWQVSSDETNWMAMENTARYKTRFTHRFERGNYFVRAIVTNKNSGAKFKTPTVRVSAYLLPKIDLEGPENVFIGGTGHYTAGPDPRGTGNDPDTPLVYQWSIDRGESWQTGDTAFEISRDDEDRVPIWVRARYETAPADDDYAWSRERARVSFRKVRPPRVRIIGPRVIETGRARDYRASVRPPYRDMDVEIRGEWTLPDGNQSADSLDLSYTATEADLANERVELAYETWIEGYKSDAATDRDTLTLRVWQYEWPEFQIHTRLGSDYAPTDISARLRSLGTTRFRDLDEPQVEWQIPDGLIVSEKAGSTIRELKVEQPGEYTVQAVVSDARGHSSTVTETLTFKTAPPYEFDIRYTASNRYDRAPMDIRVRPYISGGHPRDRIESYVYTLDGESVETEGRFGEMRIEEPGQHEIGLKIETQMGNSDAGHLELQAHENKIPTCKIKSRSASSYWRFYARCEDPDGRMAGYQWFLNGDQVGTTSYRITVRNDGAGAPTVRMIGQDDAGASSAPVIWAGDP